MFGSAATLVRALDDDRAFWGSAFLPLVELPRIVCKTAYAPSTWLCHKKSPRLWRDSNSRPYHLIVSRFTRIVEDRLGGLAAVCVLLFFVFLFMDIWETYSKTLQISIFKIRVIALSGFMF